MPSVILAGTTVGTSLSLTGDTSGELQIQTNNGATTAMTLTTGGNVGIGTSSPTVRLAVNSSSSEVARLTTTGADAYLRFVNSADSNGYIGYQSTALTFWSGGSERMRINASGNVGIGTSSPSGSLQVSNAGYAIFNNSANAQTPIAAGLSIGYNRSGANGEVSLVWGAPASTFKFEICSFASSTITPRLTIDTSGNVGIGTSSPAATLEIFKTASTAEVILRGGSSNLGGAVTFYNDISGGGNYFRSSVSGINEASAGSAILFGTTTSGNAAPTERMRIDRNGNVGIGLSNPSFKLDIVRGSSGVVLNLQGTDAYSAETGITFSTGRAKISGFLEATGGTPGASLRFFTMPNDGSVTERMCIAANGNVGIGITTPSKKLTVVGAGNVDVSYFETASAQGWSVGPVNIDSGRFNWYNENAANNRMFLTIAGALFNTTGTYGTISDVSLKENIVDATPKLSDVMKIKVRNFNLKSDPEKRKVIGVVAQEIEQVFPGLIEEVGERITLEDGLFEEKTVKAVKYSILTTILVKAVQEQQVLIEQLTTRLNALEGK
jgi:hypothetical protein